MYTYSFTMIVSVAIDNEHKNFHKAVCDWYVDRCQNFIGNEIESYSIIPLEKNIFTVKFTTKNEIRMEELEILKENLADPDMIEKYDIRWCCVYGIPIDYKV